MYRVTFDEDKQATDVTFHIPVSVESYRDRMEVRKLFRRLGLVAYSDLRYNLYFCWPSFDVDMASDESELPGHCDGEVVQLDSSEKHFIVSHRVSRCTRDHGMSKEKYFECIESDLEAMNNFLIQSFTHHAGTVIQRLPSVSFDTIKK